MERNCKIRRGASNACFFYLYVSVKEEGEKNLPKGNIDTYIEFVENYHVGWMIFVTTLLMWAWQQRNEWTKGKEKKIPQ